MLTFLPANYIAKWDTAVSECLPPHPGTQTNSFLDPYLLGNRSSGDFQGRHDRGVLDGLRTKKLLPPWNLVEAQLKKGPPTFLRPGWRSPLLGKQVDLDWLDQDGFVRIRGTKDDWRNVKVLVIEFWATYVTLRYPFGLLDLSRTDTCMFSPLFPFLGGAECVD